MTAVGWVGLGKLGAPCAAALAWHGDHDVMGYDIMPPQDWGGMPENVVQLGSTVADVVKHTDGVVYVAVQTPHAPSFGGETLLEEGTIPVDFEYGFLVNAVRTIAHEALSALKPISIVIVSTVLPGTVDRDIRPLLNEFTTLVYHPFFIAMGTVVNDFINPEFVLIGVDHESDAVPLLDLYSPIHRRPIRVISIPSAELTKVAYNTFITSKIVFVNQLAEMCDHTGADVDQVTGSLALGEERIISTKYMTAGMGDGGACHPRDNIALSSLAMRFGMHVDYMGYLVTARQAHAEWQASIIFKWMALTGLPVTLMGKTYKPDVNSTAGSPAMLLADVLAYNKISFVHADHVVEGEPVPPPLTGKPRVFFIATRHDIYTSLEFPQGSIVIDPFGFIPPSAGVTLVTPGRKVTQ